MQHIAAQYFLNHMLDADEVRRQVREFAAAGYESLYTHSRAGLLTPYLSEPWFKIIDAMADEAKKCGITLSIWDEDYYPSPTAGGRVVWADPSNNSQELWFNNFEVKAGETLYEVLPPEGNIFTCYAYPADGGEPIDITAYVGTVKTDWYRDGYLHSGYSNVNKIKAPHIRAGLSIRRCAILWEAPCDCKVVACQLVRREGGHNSDLLNPKAIDTFIQVTHEQYYKRYKDSFSDVFKASFMDEPAPPGPYQWTTAFPEEFQKDHGFDIVPKLGHLATVIDETTPFIRHCYRATQQRLLCEIYLQRIRDWDNAHGILSIGHLTRTEYLAVTCFAWPNEVRCCKYLDVPCTDPLGFFVALPDACAYHTGLKVVSSAARLFNKEQCGSDALAVMGNETSLRDLAYQMDFQTLMGITYYNIHGLSYSMDGARKEEVPPSIFYQHSEWPIMQHLLKPALAKCETVAHGKPLQRLAVLYPSTSFYCKYDEDHQDLNPDESLFHVLSERLLSHQKDFDFIDDLTLSERSAATWRKDYDAILLYKTTAIDGKAADVIQAFAEEGGKVLLIADETPVRLGTIDNAPVSPWTWSDRCRFAELSDEQLLALPGLEVVATETGIDRASARDIFIQERQYPEGRRVMVFNRAPSTFVGMVDGKAVTVPAGVSKFTDEEEIAIPAKATDISTGWSLSFPENSILLAYWLMQNDKGQEGTYNLLSRQLNFASDNSPNMSYRNVFLLQGQPAHAQLVVEKSTFTSNEWQVFINDVEVPRDAFKPACLTDCCNFAADVTAFLRGGTSPLQNTIRFECHSAQCRLDDMPFLFGTFSAEYRHGLPSLPNLWADSDKPMQVVGLPDWRAVGRGTFSGCGTYTRKVKLAQNGRHVLDCGRVEDAVELYVDGVFQGARITPFYRFAFEAEAGEHEIELRVWNAPGNRDRHSNMPAGLMGPVLIA